MLIHHDERGCLHEVFRHDGLTALPSAWRLVNGPAVGSWPLEPRAPLFPPAGEWALQGHDGPAGGPPACEALDIAGVGALSLPPPADGAQPLYHQDWGLGFALRQWNIVCSRPNSLRGVHVHPHHYDYLTVLRGSLLLYLRDLRRNSPSYGVTRQLTLQAGAPQRAWMIPPGVAHGFGFTEPSCYFYGMSLGWSMSEDLGCHWQDPALGFRFPDADPLLSPRDRAAPSLAVLEARLAQIPDLAWQP